MPGKHVRRVPRRMRQNGPLANVVEAARLFACPQHILSAAHFRADGPCACFCGKCGKQLAYPHAPCPPGCARRARIRAGKSDVSQEEFDEKLAELMDKKPASALLSVPGVYEAVSEHFNNDVLAALGADDDG